MKVITCHGAATCSDMLWLTDNTQLTLQLYRAFCVFQFLALVSGNKNGHQNRVNISLYLCCAMLALKLRYDIYSQNLGKSSGENNAK